MWRGDTVLSDKKLTRIRTPVLLLIGENDDVAVSHAESMAALMPAAELIVIPEVGHNVPQAASVHVLSEMLKFFKPGDEDPAGKSE